MVWSHVGAGAVVAGFSSQTVGLGVALGSLAAGAVALVVASTSPRLPLPMSAALTSLAMAAPLLMASTAFAYVAAMVAFNIGATYAVARFSAIAIAQGGCDTVPAVQTAAMVAGPLVAAGAVAIGGVPALVSVAVLTLAAGMAATLMSVRAAADAKTIAPMAVLHDDLVRDGS
jgi:hypothetical protein